MEEVPTHLRPAALAVLALSLAGCGSTPPRASPGDGAPPAASAPAASAPGQGSAPSPPSPAPAASAASAAPPLVLTLVGPSAVEIAASAPTRVTSRASIERVDERGQGADVSQHFDVGAGYRLVESCDGAAPARCVDLAAGGALRPVPFQGFDCAAQCNRSCRANTWVGPGTFRFVVSTCDGARAASPTFTLPAPAQLAATPRLFAAANVTRARATRATLPIKWDPEAARDQARFAGLSPTGPTRDLDEAARARLTELLASASGYDDDIRKRCAMGPLVAFRLTKTLATTGAPREGEVDVAIDFTCQKIFVMWDEGPGGRRAVHGSHFDPSRAGFLALAKGVFPQSADLR